MKCFPIGRKNGLIKPPTLSQYKNGAEWLKYECPSNIINFTCLLLKADFRIFYFELETLLNKLVKLCDYFGYECFISIKKVNLFSNRPFTLSENITDDRKNCITFLILTLGLHLLYLLSTFAARTHEKTH